MFVAPLPHDENEVKSSGALDITTGSYVSVHHREARGKFGEHKRCVGLAPGTAMSYSNFSTAV